MSDVDSDPTSSSGMSDVSSHPVYMSFGCISFAQGPGGGSWLGVRARGCYIHCAQWPAKCSLYSDRAVAGAVTYYPCTNGGITVALPIATACVDGPVQLAGGRRAARRAATAPSLHHLFQLDPLRHPRFLAEVAAGRAREIDS